MEGKSYRGEKGRGTIRVRVEIYKLPLFYVHLSTALPAGPNYSLPATRHRKVKSLMFVFAITLSPDMISVVGRGTLAVTPLTLANM
jgi:hypothetical protein